MTFGFLLSGFFVVYRLEVDAKARQGDDAGG